MNQKPPAGPISNPDLDAIRAFTAGSRPAGPIDTSPLLVALGAELVGFDAARKELLLRYAPEDLFRQGAGVIQGGAVTAMLDCAMAFAGLAAGEAGTTITTANMNISFLAPAAGATYEARGWISKQGRRVMFAGAELSAGGRPVAAATSTLLVV
ncbi:PaaI family thioesterase [Mesorhizobium sp. J428]|uniref:PaaI family thioesterase n=1 Tax=Mesorhizobium sp. J428 TaxID=2898440 RepID=UPI002150AA01|nr:PaaI family thioesterase [Mesorhizobium sp. J428]MCR5855736.1 PaaI family thioesterase [Mesorhizobium sp. J428]